MSWRIQNILSLLAVAAVLALNCLPDYSSTQRMTHAAHADLEAALARPQPSRQERGVSFVSDTAR